MAAIGQARCGVAGGGERAARGAPRERGPNARSSVFALRVRGTGMAEDGLYDGDRLIVERCAPADGRTAVVEVDGRLAVKRVFRDRDGVVRLQPASPTLLPLVVPAKEVRVLGAVVAVFRRHGFRRTPRSAPRPSSSRVGVTQERVAMRPASVRPPLVHELARSLRSLRQCYAGTANRRLREALVREARDIVRRVCGFDVELP